MLKLAKLPDRTPVRIIINVSPAINQDLAAYADAYRQTYGTEESVAELIPFMLESFLAADRGFAQARKAGTPASEDARGPRKSKPSPTLPTTEDRS